MAFFFFGWMIEGMQEMKECHYTRICTGIKEKLLLLGVQQNCLLLGRAWASPTVAGLHCADVCVYDRPCLRPYTINFKCAFKYFPNIEHPCALAWQCRATARVQHWQLRTDHQQQAAHRPYKIIHRRLRSLQVRVVHKRHSLTLPIQQLIIEGLKVTTSGVHHPTW